MISVTISQLRSWHACELDRRIAALRAHLDRDVPLDEPIPVAVWAEAPGISDADLRWMLSCSDAGRRILIALACDYAEMALTLWRARYPADSRPARCLAAVRAWLADPTPERLASVRAAGLAAARAAAAAADESVAGFAAAAVFAARAVRMAFSAAAATAAYDAATAAAYATRDAAARRARARQRERLLAYLRGEVTP